MSILTDALQALPDQVVAQCVREPELARELLSLTLAARGLDLQGNWMGFTDAMGAHLDRFPASREALTELEIAEQSLFTDRELAARDA